jgi:hypothetical protein
MPDAMSLSLPKTRGAYSLTEPLSNFHTFTFITSVVEVVMEYVVRMSCNAFRSTSGSEGQLPQLAGSRRSPQAKYSSNAKGCRRSRSDCASSVGQDGSLLYPRPCAAVRRGRQEKLGLRRRTKALRSGGLQDAPSRIRTLKQAEASTTSGPLLPFTPTNLAPPLPSCLRRQASHFS